MLRLTALLLVPLLPLAVALCPEGAVQGTRPEDCYLYGSAQSWQEAEQFCVANKGRLSSVPNAFVNAFLVSYPNALTQSYWLGAELKSATDKWAWTDGSDFVYTKWAAGEPKQGPGCLYTNASTGQWHSGGCDATKPFICKVPSSCNSAPQKCDDGWTFNEKLNKCYKTLSGGFNWDSAYIACRDQGAHLPSIHDDAENIAFAEVARGYPLVILGLKNTGGAPWSKKEYNFVWSDGSFFNYSQLPWNDDGAFDCVFYQAGEHGEKYQWALMNCLAPTSTATAVCQKSPKVA